MASAELNLVVGLVDKASGPLKSLAGSLGGIAKIGGAAFLGGAVAGVGALSAALVAGIGDARQANIIMAQTENVIKSTGGAAGVTAQQVADLSGSLSAAAGKSLFGDDQIQESANLLLTFTNLKGGVLDAATAMSVDLAQAMGGAPADAAVQLGKALNDPINGISALSRVGVSFTDQQKEQIKTMQEAGDVAGAQGVILAELNKEFGGSAAAAAAADGGMAQFKDRMGELAESIGAMVLPMLNQLMAWLNSPDVQAGIDKIVTGLVDGLGAAFSWLSGTAIPMLVAGWQMLQPAITNVRNEIAGFVDTWNNIVAAFQDGGLSGALQESILALQAYGGRILGWITEQAAIWGPQILAWGEAFIGWVAPMIPLALAQLGTFAAGIGSWILAQAPIWAAQVLTWGQAFIGWISPYVGQALTALTDFALQIGNWIVAQAPIWAAQVLAWGEAFVGWISPYIGQAITMLTEFATQIGAWIVAQVPALAAQLLAWGQAFITWIAPQIPGLLEQAQSLAAQFIGWIGAQAAPILARLAEWGKSLVAWIGPATVDFLGKWPGFLNDFLQWIGSAAGPLLLKLGEWALKFIEWIAPMIPPFLVALAGVAAALVVFIAETAGVILGNVAQWALAMYSWVEKEAIPRLKTALTGIGTAIAGYITSAVGWIGQQAASIGSSLVDGIRNGVSGAWGRFTGWLDAQISKIPKVIRDVLGIHSPSREMIPIGEALPEGLQVGWQRRLLGLQQVIIGSLRQIVGTAADAVRLIAPTMIEPITAALAQAPHIILTQGNAMVDAIRLVVGNYNAELQQIQHPDFTGGYANGPTPLRYSPVTNGQYTTPTTPMTPIRYLPSQSDGGEYSAKSGTTVNLTINNPRNAQDVEIGLKRALQSAGLT